MSLRSPALAAKTIASSLIGSKISLNSLIGCNDIASLSLIGCQDIASSLIGCQDIASSLIGCQDIASLSPVGCHVIVSLSSTGCQDLASSSIDYQLVITSLSPVAWQDNANMRRPHTQIPNREIKITTVPRETVAFRCLVLLEDNIDNFIRNEIKMHGEKKFTDPTYCIQKKNNNPPIKRKSSTCI